MAVQRERISTDDLDLANLPPVVDTDTAAQILGIGRDLAYKLVREHRAPIEVLHLGRAIRWPTARLLALIGEEGWQNRDTDERELLTSTEGVADRLGVSPRTVAGGARRAPPPAA